MPYPTYSPEPRASLSATCLTCPWHEHSTEARDRAERHTATTGHTTEVTSISITQFEKRKAPETIYRSHSAESPKPPPRDKQRAT